MFLGEFHHSLALSFVDEAQENGAAILSLEGKDRKNQNVTRSIPDVCAQ